MPVVTIASAAETVPIRRDNNNGTPDKPPSISSSSSSASTTTTPVVGTTATATDASVAIALPESQHQSAVIVLPEPFYPIKSCLSSKSLFIDDDDDGVGTRSVPSSPKIKKSVSFHKIKIREHERTISDNPSVSSGIGLGIGWESIDSLQCSVDEWEIYRPPRRTKSNLIIPSNLRTQILRNECDITDSQINDSMRQIAHIKMSRQQASKDPVVVIPENSYSYNNKNIANNTTATTSTSRTTASVASTAVVHATTTVTPIPRRRSFMGLPRFFRPAKNIGLYDDNNNANNSALVDMEVEQLMERSLRAEKIRQQQRMDIIKALQQKDQEERFKVEEKKREEENQQQQQQQQQPELMNDSPSTTTSTNGTTDTTTFTEPSHTEPLATAKAGETNHSNSLSSLSPPQLPTVSSHVLLSSPSPFATPATTTTTTTTTTAADPRHVRKSSDEMEDDEAWEF